MYKMYKHEGMCIIGGEGNNIWLKYHKAQELILSPVCMDKNDGNKVT